MDKKEKPEYYRDNPETPTFLLNAVADPLLRIKKEGPLLVAVNGKDAAGKTVFAANLTERLRQTTERPVVHVSFDGFLNHSSIRNAPFEHEGRGSYEHAFNYQAFVDYFLAPLSRKDSWSYVAKVYDLQSDQTLEPEPRSARGDTIFVVDGLFLLREELRPYWDTTILLDVDTDTLVDRGVARDAGLFGGVDKTRTRYLTRYMPSQEIYFSEQHPLDYADIVIDNNDPQHPHIRSSRLIDA